MQGWSCVQPKGDRFLNLKIRIKGVEFQNPIILASGTFEYGTLYKEVIEKLGGVVTKGITLKPREGNPPPRIYESSSGIVNSVGLENPGIERFKRGILPKISLNRSRFIVNIAGESIKDYVRLADLLSEEKIDGLELNVSCPNVEKGTEFGQDPESLYRLVKEVRKYTHKLLIVKLTPNFVDPLETAKACEDGGADAVSLINTLYALVIDPKKRTYFLGGGRGGLSGPGIKPFALYCVHRVAEGIDIPVIGGGGITGYKDVIEFLLAGAFSIFIGSANLTNPFISVQILKDLRRYLRENKIENIKELIGGLKEE